MKKSIALERLEDFREVIKATEKYGTPDLGSKLAMESIRRHEQELEIRCIAVGICPKCLKPFKTKIIVEMHECKNSETKV